MRKIIDANGDVCIIETGIPSGPISTCHDMNPNNAHDGASYHNGTMMLYDVGSYDDEHVTVAAFCTFCASQWHEHASDAHANVRLFTPHMANQFTPR